MTTRRFAAAALAACYMFIPAGVFADGTLPTAMPGTAGVSQGALAQIDPYVTQLVDRAEIPGAVVVIAHNGAIVYRKTFGKRALYPNPQANTADTLYDLASMSKPIGTATAIMKLVEQGKIRLWDRVSVYDKAFAQNKKELVTVEQLLNHSAGLPSALNERQSILPAAQGEALIDKMALHFAPGTRYEYCNTCYIELAKIVRLVSGEPIGRFTERTIFGPLGLGSDLLFNPPPAAHSRVSPEGHDAAGRYGRGQFMIAGFGPIGALGHAGLFGTADAVAAYGQMLLNGGTLHDVRVLSPATVATMIRPYYFGRPHKRFGDVRSLGWDEATDDSSNRGELFGFGGFGHTGSTGCSLWIDPATHTVVVVLTNSAHAKVTDDDDIVRLYAKISTIAASAVAEPDTLERMQQQAATWSAQVAAQAAGFDALADREMQQWRKSGSGGRY